MAKIPNTSRRGGVYYFRRRVPGDLQGVLKTSELCCSLRTLDSASARRLSRILYLGSEELFQEARRSPMLTEDQLSLLVQDFYSLILERDNHVRLTAPEPMDDDYMANRISYYAELAASSKRDLARNAFGSAAIVTKAMLAKHGLDGRLEPLEVRKVQQAMLRAGVDVAEAVKARLEGNFNYEPMDKLLKARVETVFPDVQPRPRADPAEPSAPAEAAADVVETPAFSAVAEEFRKEQLAARLWEQQTALQARKTFQLFVEIAGDKPLGRYGREDAIRFKGILQQLPADYGKAAQFRGLSAVEIVDRTAHLGTQRLSPRTVKRHFSALSALFDASIMRGEVLENPFSGFKFPSTKRPNQQRDMWSSDDLARLFATPVWTGCQSDSRRSKPGSLILRDEKFWLPLIAVFSGMRQEEICQLHCNDVRVESGIPVFDINATPPRQLKNRNAVRLVPIHSQLISLGLLEHAERQRRSGELLLFSGLKPGGADARLGHNYTKWFTRYRRDVGLYREGLDFHSFRHSATTFLQWAQVPAAIIDDLTGHQTAGETARYTKRFQISQLKEAIEKIDIGFQLFR